MEILTEKQITAPEIHWDFGTAYELFVSLHVLHEPEYFGIRPAYAASVRARIPVEERKLLEDVFRLTGVPLKWLADLTAPKDAISALWALKQIPPAERLLKLQRVGEPIEFVNEEDKEKHARFDEILQRVASEGKWTEADADHLFKTFHKKHGGMKRDAIERALDWWSRPEELGEGYLSALNAYYQAFFEEDEKRVEPILRAGLENAQTLASKLTFEKLFLELSQGIKLEEEFRAEKFIIAPAFWTTPLIFFEKLDRHTMLMLFGTRPADMSVIPGETVPDALVRSLKALADPTRLKILYYLSHESLTPAEIARRLHLRPPTVTHHLRELRLASLVELSFKQEENRYTIRKQALDQVCGNMRSFLEKAPE
ncbi:MAG: metalloregulator ArsR/SmtB family transcription factor [Anaerolineales bacterium]|nr:MAG: metalloregulator ArsR/SmtB family transcription factor [Anaerolineales bacterium]